MQLYKTVLMILQILSAISIIILVLMQQNKGEVLGTSFNGSSTNLLNPTGSSIFLSRMIGLFSVIFFLLTLLMTWIESKKSENQSVLSVMHHSSIKQTEIIKNANITTTVPSIINTKKNDTSTK